MTVRTLPGQWMTGTRYFPQTVILGLPVRREDLTPRPPETATTAATSTATSWLDQQIIPGVKNTWLALGGALAAAMFFGRNR